MEDVVGGMEVADHLPPVTEAKGIGLRLGPRILQASKIDPVGGDKAIDLTGVGIDGPALMI